MFVVKERVSVWNPYCLFCHMSSFSNSCSELWCTAGGFELSWKYCLPLEANPIKDKAQDKQTDTLSSLHFDYRRL